MAMTQPPSTGMGCSSRFESNECDAEGREQQDERIQERRNDAGSMIPKCFGFCSRLGRKEMGVEGKKERALVDEVMARIAHESHAIEDPSADELSDDDRRVQGQGDRRERRCSYEAKVAITYSVARPSHLGKGPGQVIAGAIGSILL